MPYIKQERRRVINPYDIDAGYYVNDPPANVAGELNFVFTMVIKDYIENKGLSYQTINDIIGALEGAKLEFYRRVAAPYEQEKCKLNGDVY